MTAQKRLTGRFTGLGKDNFMDKKTTTTKIGNTTYIVNCFNCPSADKVKEKIARLIKNETAKMK